MLIYLVRLSVLAALTKIVCHKVTERRQGPHIQEVSRDWIVASVLDFFYQNRYSISIVM